MQAGPGESGVLLAKIGPLMAFEGFEDPADNAASILVNPFGKDERYVNTRDLMTLHEGQWVSFAARVGDDVRLPGSTLTSADIEDICEEASGVRDACAYPVTTDGERAVMVALVVDATFSFDAAHNPTTNASGVVALATGSLIQGSVSTSPAMNGATPSYVPSANATVTFNPLPAQAAFFQSPVGFYDLGFAAFTNTVSQVTVLETGDFKVDVLVPAGKAAELAARNGTGRLALVLEARER